MTNRKTMDVQAAIRTVLLENPILKVEFLIGKVKEITGRSRSTICHHIHILVAEEVIFRVRKGYYSLERPRLGKFEDKHRKDIAAGLLALAGAPRYTVEGVIVPDVGKMEESLQHLRSGHSKICLLLPSDIGLFQERAKGLSRDLESGVEGLKGRCKECIVWRGGKIEDEDAKEVKKLLEQFWNLKV